MNARSLRRRRQVDELVDRVAIDELIDAQGPLEIAPVAIVIAAYKERDNIAQVIEGMPKEVCGLQASLIVVVDGEDDGTGAVVREAGHYACVAPVNRGQGAALRLGYRIARENGARFIVTSDADGQTDPDDLEVVLEPVLSGRADFVNGSRRLGRTHGTDAVRNTGVLFFAALISLLTRTAVTDTANPVRAFRAELPAELTLEEPQYQAQELLISAIMHGCRYEERPVTMRARLAGESKKSGNLFYGLHYGRGVLDTWLRERKRRPGQQIAA
ncbi:MAG: glycosyltransferase family 2 protein [Acidimicrobiales bacterium]